MDGIARLNKRFERCRWRWRGGNSSLSWVWRRRVWGPSTSRNDSLRESLLFAQDDTTGESDAVVPPRRRHCGVDTMVRPGRRLTLGLELLAARHSTLLRRTSDKRRRLPFGLRSRSELFLYCIRVWLRVSTCGRAIPDGLASEPATGCCWRRTCRQIRSGFRSSLWCYSFFRTSDGRGACVRGRLFP